MTDSLKQQFERIRTAEKFQREDREYLDKRQQFSKDIGVPGLWPLIDQFGVYVGIQTLATRLAVYEILRRSIDVPGHIVEFGVWHGANLLFMAKVLRLLRPQSHKSVIGFDSFEGLTTFRPQDGDGATHYAGQYRGNEEILLKAIELYDMQDWVHLVKGDAIESIPAFAEAFPHAIVSFGYIDFDLYEPCRVALQFLGTRLSTGGIIAFDEACMNLWPGEGVALLEFLRESSGMRFEMFTSDIARQPTVYVVKR